MVKVVELQEPFPEDEVPSQARSNSVNLERVFLSENCRKGFPSNLRCWFWFCCSSHQKKGVLIKKGLLVVGNWLFFRRVVSFDRSLGE